MYNFRTQHFGLTDNEIHLMRSRFPYKKIAFKNIQRIEIKKSIRTKHPIRVIVFGTLILLFILWLFKGQYQVLTPNILKDKELVSGARGYAALLTAIGFLIVISALSFSQVLFKKHMLMVVFTDGSDELLPITEIRKNNKTMDLIRFLTNNFDNATFRFHDSLINTSNN